MGDHSTNSAVNTLANQLARPQGTDWEIEDFVDRMFSDLTGTDRNEVKPRRRRSSSGQRFHTHAIEERRNQLFSTASSTAPVPTPKPQPVDQTTSSTQSERPSPVVPIVTARPATVEPARTEGARPYSLMTFALVVVVAVVASAETAWWLRGQRASPAAQVLAPQVKPPVVLAPTLASQAVAALQAKSEPRASTATSVSAKRAASPTQREASEALEIHSAQSDDGRPPTRHTTPAVDRAFDTAFGADEAP